MSILDIFKPRPILRRTDDYAIYRNNETDVDPYWIEVMGDYEEDGDGGCYGEPLSYKEFAELVEASVTGYY